MGLFCFSLNMSGQSQTLLVKTDNVNITSYKQSLITKPSIAFKTKSVLNSNIPKEEFSDQTYISIPKAYCYDDLALFCKLEVQLDKAFKMPIRIRLGNLAYVNYLEGK